MKIKTDAIAIPKDVQSLLGEEQDQPSDTMAKDVQANEAAIREYIASARQHMEGLKAELYKVLDAGYDNAAHYSLVKPVPKIFLDKPSAFIERAYTIQVYDENGAPCENRKQDYIQAGMDYSKYCETNAQILNDDQLLLNDAGKLIGAINSAISQLNRVEACLIKAQKNDNEYEIAGGVLQISLRCIETVLNQASASKLVELVPNQNIIEKLLSALSDIASSIGNFFANIGKSEEQQNKEQFASYKEKYKAQQPLPVDALESTEESELNEVQEPDAEEHSSLTLK